MLKIAICDDDYNDIEQCDKVVENYNSSHALENQFTIKNFQHPATLRDEIEDGERFDAFILDIAMEMMDGFTLAKEIRRYMPNAALIFLSSHTEFNFTQEGYKVRALRYVSKLSMETGLIEALETAAEACKDKDVRYYTVTHYNDIMRIPLSEIIYIHRVSRTTELITENHGQPILRKPLKDVVNELGDRRFIYTDRSSIVNGDYVISVHNSALTLRNGEILPVSRKMMPAVKTELLRLWGGLQ